jgi:sugar phosphate isomerase/epimerase
MPSKFDVSRRRFLTGAAGAAGMAALGPFAARGLGAGEKVGERLVPPGKLAVQQFSIRDAITRRSIASSNAAGIAPTMGYLGGPDFPEDPSDLGPLVPLPGGFLEVFEFLAGVGYRGFEFFQYTQNINELGRQPTHAEIRAYLDAAGLLSVGTHTGGLSMVDPTVRAAQITIAQTLGHSMIGTAGDPSPRGTLADGPNPNNPAQLQRGWQFAADNYNAVGEILAAEGLKMYLHPEQNTFRTFDPATEPSLSLVHRLDWFADNTDPNLVFFEPDLLHMYAGRARFPTANGSLFDAVGWLQRNEHRIVAWHAKDGSRLTPPPAAGINPFTQTIVRPPQFTGTPANNVDTIYSLEGSLSQGYPVDPDPAVIGWKRIFSEIGAKGEHFVIIESDSGPGPATDPGRSLRHAKISAANLLGFRGGVAVKKQSTVADEAVYESDEAFAG